MNCPRCRHQNRATASFCGECGASLARGDACGRCATVNPPGQRFCDGCGMRLDAGAPAPAPRVLPSTPSHLVEKVMRGRRALEGERKLVTILFADIVHSMEMAE